MTDDGFLFILDLTKKKIFLLTKCKHGNVCVENSKANDYKKRLMGVEGRGQKERDESQILVRVRDISVGRKPFWGVEKCLFADTA